MRYFLSFFLLLVFSGLAHATSRSSDYDYFSYRESNPVLGGDRGIANRVRSVRSFYTDEYRGNEGKEVFSFAFSHKRHRRWRNNNIDGFWAVISPGEDPKTNVDEYTIFYGDLKKNRLTSYVYDGKNSANSYQNSTYPGSHRLFTSNLRNGMSYTRFTLDVTDMNNMNLGSDWQGAKFGENIGIWFHPSSGSNFSYNSDGSLSNFSFTKQGWYDVSNQPTHVHISAVPEPEFYALFLLGSISIFYYRKKKSQEIFVNLG